jgi:hypothetical protein
VTGVTTNPILLEKAKVACHVKSLAVLANRAFELVRNPTFLQVLCVLAVGFCLFTSYRICHHKLQFTDSMKKA